MINIINKKYMFFTNQRSSQNRKMKHVIERLYILPNICSDLNVYHNDCFTMANIQIH